MMLRATAWIFLAVTIFGLTSCGGDSGPPSHADVMSKIEDTITRLEVMEKDDRMPIAEVEERLKSIKYDVGRSTMDEKEAELLVIALDFMIPVASMQLKVEENGDAADAAYFLDGLRKVQKRFK